MRGGRCPVRFEIEDGMVSAVADDGVSVKNVPLDTFASRLGA
jgi:hypothetical protein